MKAPMLARVQSYLRHRRSLGYALRVEGELLVSDGPKTDETCRFENRVLAGGSKTPSEGCSDGGVRLDWFSVQGGLIWSLVR